MQDERLCKSLNIDIVSSHTEAQHDHERGSYEVNIKIGAESRD